MGATNAAGAVYLSWATPSSSPVLCGSCWSIVRLVFWRSLFVLFSLVIVLHFLRFINLFLLPICYLQPFLPSLLPHSWHLHDYYPSKTRWVLHGSRNCLPFRDAGVHLHYFYGIRVVRLQLSVFIRVDHCLFLSELFLFLLLYFCHVFVTVCWYHGFLSTKKSYHSVEKPLRRLGFSPKQVI